MEKLGTYNKFMHKLKCLLLAFTMSSTQMIFAADTTTPKTVDQVMADQKAACDKNTSMTWSLKLNRCIGKQSSVDTRNAAKACDSLTDVAAKEKCNLNLAEKQTGLSSDTASLNQGNTTGSMVMNGVATAYTALSFISAAGSTGEKSNCTSRTIFAVTSIAGLASDVFLKMKAKKKVQELEGKYKLDKTSSASEAQVKALEYLKEEQQTVVSIASMEKKRNMALMLGYGISTAWAIYEMMNFTTPACTETAATDKNAVKSGEKTLEIEAKPSAAPELNDGGILPGVKVSPTSAYIKLLLDKAFGIGGSLFMSSAHAQMMAGMMASMQKQLEPIKEWLGTPKGIAIAGGIATVYSKVLYDGAVKQEAQSKENVTKVEKIIASFKDSYAAFCPSGREDMNSPKCYCYNSDGTKNTGRTNSQTCITLWEKDNYKLSGDATNYNLEAYNADVAGCVTVTSQFDETCKCKKLIDSSGKNACKKETSISLSADSFGTGLATDVATVAKISANSANGNPRFDLLNSATLGAKAIKATKLAEQLLSKIPENKRPNVPLINESNVDKYAKAMIGERNLASGSRSGSPLNVASTRSDNPAIANALKVAEAKAGLELSGGNGLNAKKEKKKNSFDLNLGGDSSSNGGGQVVQGFPEEKNYKFKNSDIVTDNSASIFEIISNRYVQSGLRRLFDEGEEKK